MNVPLMSCTDDDNDNDADSAESNTSEAAAPMQTAKYVYGGLAAGFVGLAAAL